MGDLGTVEQAMAPAARKEPAPPDQPEPSFDARLARLEAIVAELENGGLALEASIERYQEGVRLLSDCRGVLAGYQRRVEELSSEAAGALKPYPNDPDAR